MKVRDLMNYSIYTVSPDVPVTEAIGAMVEGHKGCVLIAREGLLKEVEGIVTTGEIFRKVLINGLNPAKVKVSEIMTPAPLITVNPEATTRDAARLMMEHRIRRLPVVEGEALVGIITTKDLMACVK